MMLKIKFINRLQNNSSQKFLFFFLSLVLQTKIFQTNKVRERKNRRVKLNLQHLTQQKQQRREDTYINKKENSQQKHY